MITTSFEKILQLNIQHQYFSDEGAGDIFKFEMMSVLSDYPAKLKLQQLSNNCSLFHEKSVSAMSGLADHISDTGDTNGYTFNFPINILDSSFFNYTNLDFQAEKVLYIRYNNAPVLKASEGEWLDIKAKQFVYPLAAEDMERLSAIKLERTNGQTIPVALPERPYGNGILVNLFGEPDDAYQLVIDFKNPDKRQTYSFFCSDRLVQVPPNIIVGVDSKTQDKNLSLTLSFDARQVYLKYFFLGLKKDEDWNTGKISSFNFSGQNINFIKATSSEVLENGQSAYTAVSDHPVPFLQRPNWNIKYSSDQISQGFQLPYPSPDNTLRIEEEPDGQIRYLSNIYCYI